MANNLKIEGNFLIITNTIAPFEMFVHEVRKGIKFSRTVLDEYQFQYDVPIVGGVNIDYTVASIFTLFPFADFIDDRTGIAFVSVAELDTFLHENIGNISDGGGSYVLPQSTESVLGGAEIATQVETDAGTDDLRIVTPLKLSNYPFPSGGDTYYSQKSTNINGGTVNAVFGTPLECVPSLGVLEITVIETGDYIIFGRVNIGTNLNKDNGAIELIYGIDTGSGAIAGLVPYTQNQQAKKKKANGISGTWGGVSLTVGDKVHLFLSTLGDSTTWTEAEIFIATWK